MNCNIIIITSPNSSYKLLEISSKYMSDKIEFCSLVNARNGKNDAAKKELSSVTGKLAERAAKDIEFAKL